VVVYIVLLSKIYRAGRCLTLLLMATRAASTALRNRESLRLYKTILRALQRFEDPNARNYYYHYARAHFIGHRDESDPERIHQIIERGKNDMKWILAKYGYY
jgi:hypothetical protein